MTQRHMALVVAGLVAAGAAQADPVHGTWQTQPDDGAYAHVQMAPCGANTCGVIARTFNASGEYQSENVGKTLVIDMAAEGGGKYKGQVWRPSNDKVYIGRMQLNGDSLDLRGCVAGGLLCSKQVWSRVK